MATAHAMSDKILRRKLSHEVFDRLFALIEQGEVEPDEQLPSERELMVRFGVGRPAIREALQTLETMGLIAISHGERARVTQPTAFGAISQIDHSARHLLATSPRSLDHLKEAREFFEVGMAREASARATAANIKRLSIAIERQRAQLGKDPAEFVAADMAFHTEIAGLTGNPIFEAASRAMLRWLSRFHSGVLRWQGKERRTLAEHEEILEAIAAHDAERAAEAMRSHLRRTRSNYERTTPKTRTAQRRLRG
jgi:GntR family transcriptional regulator, sialic acid-inducible nan operon repressor